MAGGDSQGAETPPQESHRGCVKRKQPSMSVVMCGFTGTFAQVLKHEATCTAINSPHPSAVSSVDLQNKMATSAEPSSSVHAEASVKALALGQQSELQATYVSPSRCNKTAKLQMLQI